MRSWHNWCLKFWFSTKLPVTFTITTYTLPLSNVLILYNNEFFALTCLFLLSFINLFVRSSPDQMFGTTGMSTGRGVLTTSTHTSHTGTCNNFPTSRWWWDMAALALLSSYFIAIWQVFLPLQEICFYQLSVLKNSKSTIHLQIQ